MSLGQKKSASQYHYVPGFGDLADFIASDHDHSAAVYRRFDRLAARDLLYYQSELSRLQARQDALDIEDRKELDQHAASWRDVSRGACDWESLRESRNKTPQSDVERRNRERMDLAMEIRKTLKEYREALIQESTLLSYDHPSTQTMKAVGNYLHGPVDDPTHPHATHPTLTGVSSELYPRDMSESHIQTSDYVTLRPRDGAELLTCFLKRYCSRWFRIERPPLLVQYGGDTISHFPRNEIRHYSEQRIRLVASFITTLTAAMLLIAPIYTLYHTASSSPALTLGLIVLFTFVFSGAIKLMTQARRAEIFGACAAYAAVLVVFVSGDFVGDSQGT
ncbi:hypothetical protein PG985_002700 [Apiospora marii]|uniref:DUF6594 domain-containing protein n=1 Tax=Apiospora marii TaxID=335849 RepID=A0ABR1RTU3_9PEZI